MCKNKCVTTVSLPEFTGTGSLEPSVIFFLPQLVRTIVASIAVLFAGCPFGPIVYDDEWLRDNNQRWQTPLAERVCENEPNPFVYAPYFGYGFLRNGKNALSEAINYEKRMTIVLWNAVRRAG